MSHNKTRILSTVILAGLSQTPYVMAQEASPRPILSELFTSPDIVTAIAEATVRSKAANEHQMQRFTEHEGPMEDFERNDPILQQVSWPYGTCTDLMSLVPPPMEGWGLRSETLANERFETADTFFAINYVTFDQSNGDDYPGREQSISITINGAPDVSTTFEMAIANPALRDTIFVDGPFGYPVSPYDMNSAVLGSYLVKVVGTGETNAPLYFQEIMRCAIDNDLIAKGVDPATLTDTP